MLYVCYAVPPHDAHKLSKHNENAVQLGPSAGLSWLQHSKAGKSSGNPKILAITFHILGVWVCTRLLQEQCWSSGNLTLLLGTSTYSYSCYSKGLGAKTQKPNTKPSSTISLFFCKANLRPGLRDKAFYQAF